MIPGIYRYIIGCAKRRRDINLKKIVEKMGKTG